MNCKKTMATAALGLTMLAGLAVAQPPMGGGPGGPGGPGGFGALLGPMGKQLLDLTDAQETQIEAIMDATRTSTESLRTQLKSIHDQEQAAVLAGKSDAELSALANSAAPVAAQLEAAMLSAQARVIKLLTPDQLAKLTKLKASMHNGGQRRGFRRPPADQ